MRTSLKSFHEFLDVILPQVFGQIHLGRDQIYEITTSHHELTVQPRYLSPGLGCHGGCQRSFLQSIFGALCCSLGIWVISHSYGKWRIYK